MTEKRITIDTIRLGGDKLAPKTTTKTPGKVLVVDNALNMFYTKCVE